MKNDNKNDLPGIAVIGSGYWGKNLVRNYFEMGALKLICDKNERLLSDFERQYKGIESCLALSEVIAREDISGVVIATPAETHYRLAKEALLAKKHVYLEKPLVLMEENGKELIDLALSKQRILMVGHLLQYHPVFVRLREIISSGELGRINYIYSHRLNLGKIRREENILWSFAPHDISMILTISGEEPESVVATGGNYLHRKIADVTTTHLDFPSGLKAHIFVSWLHPFKEQKLIVVGEKKMAVFDDTKPWADKLLIYPHEITWVNNLPIPAKANPERLDIPEAEPLRMECKHFLRCITNGQRPFTDGHEGLRVLKVLNASQRSLDDSGRRIFLSRKERKEDVARPSDAAKSGQTSYFVHKSAFIDKDVNVGKGTKVWHFSHILSGTQIGENCNIGQNVVVGPDVTVGNQCKIQNNVSIYKGITLEDGVFCGPSMVFTNVYNPRAEIKKMDQVRPTTVKKGATIGANATIVCGVTIGRYAFIGAGAVVNKDVKDHALVVGNPGRQIGWVCECGGKLEGEKVCPDCGRKHQNIGGSSSESVGRCCRNQKLTA